MNQNDFTLVSWIKFCDKDYKKKPRALKHFKNKETIRRILGIILQNYIVLCTVNQWTGFYMVE